MAGLSYKDFRGHIVFYDTELPHRWIDAYGPNVRKYELVGQYHPDSATVTAVSVGAGTSAITGLESTLGGGFVFTSAAAENDGVQMQALGEAFYFGVKCPAYFGCRVALNDATESDAFVGLAIQDTTILAACTDSIGFRKDDEDTAYVFTINHDSAATDADLGDVVADTYINLEFYYDGVTTVSYYVDDVLISSVETTAANMPDDEHLAPALAFLTGDASANTMTVLWARWIQIYD